MRLKKNLTIGIFAVIVAILAYIFSYSQIDMGMYIETDRNISPATFPRFAAVLLGIFGICNIVKSLVFKQETEIDINTKGEAKIFICFISFMLYLFLFNILGFVISTILLSSFVLFVEGCKKWQYYIIVAAITLVVFLFFRYGLKLSKLPWGIPLKYIFGGR